VLPASFVGSSVPQRTAYFRPISRGAVTLAVTSTCEPGQHGIVRWMKARRHLAPATSTQLSRLVAERLRELHLSYEAAEAQAGRLVSHGTLHRLAAGLHRGALRENTIRGVALALDLPQSTVRAALPRKMEHPTRPFVLPPRADQLDAAERRLVLDHIDRLIAKRRAI
jgi:hypothetical protein